MSSEGFHGRYGYGWREARRRTVAHRVRRVIAYTAVVLLAAWVTAAELWQCALRACPWLR